VGTHPSDRTAIVKLRIAVLTQVICL